MVLLNPPIIMPSLSSVQSLEDILPISKYEILRDGAKLLKNGKKSTVELLDDLTLNIVEEFIATNNAIEENGIDLDNNNQDEIAEQTTELEAEPFRIVELSGKGTGMVATRNLFPGDIILAEKPLIFISDEVYEDIEKTEELIDKQVLNLDSKQREMLFDLTDSNNPLDPTYLGIFYTNDMTFDGDAVLCPVMARANHSCVPNAEFVTRRDKGEQRLITIYPIKAGEEVMINYMAARDEGSETRDMRRQYLREWYKFQCLCKACTLQNENLGIDEARREELKQLQSVEESNLTNGELESMIELVYKIQGKLSYVLDLLDVLYSKKDNRDPFLSLKYGIKGLDLALNLEGEGSELVQKWRDRLELHNSVEWNVLN